jgi:hypothetical protein
MPAPDVPPLDPQTAAAVAADAARLAPLKSAFAHAGLAEAWQGSHLVSWDDLRAMASLQDLFFTHHFASHRPVVGRLIVLAKRVTTVVLNRLLKIVLVRQVELNQRTWNLALNVRLLEDRVISLEKRLKERP